MKATPLRRIALMGSAVLAYSGATTLARRVRRRRGDHRIYILTYHEVGGGPEEPEGTISATRFHSHVRYLKSCFDVVSLADATAMLAEDTPLRNDCVAITFDDGYIGNRTYALPILSAESVPATVFVTTGFLDGSALWFDVARACFSRLRRGEDGLAPELVARLTHSFGSWPLPYESDIVERMKRMPGDERRLLVEALVSNLSGTPTYMQPLTWDDVRQMASAGIEIGSHTVTHPILSTIDAREQRDEIREAKRRIEQEIGHEPRFFAYPNGGDDDFTEETTAILKESGFEAACSTVQGSNTPGCDLFRLQRIGVGADPWHLLEARFSGLLDTSVRRRMMLEPREAAVAAF